MSAQFKKQRYTDALLVTLRAAASYLSRRFPAGTENPNELPDTPLRS